MNCPNCGGTVSPNTRTCTQCGKFIAKTDNTSYQKSNISMTDYSVSSATKKIALVYKWFYSLCGIFCIIGFYMLFFYKAKTETVGDIEIRIDRFTGYSNPAMMFFVIALICAVIASGAYIGEKIERLYLKYHYTSKEQISKIMEIEKK